MPPSTPHCPTHHTHHILNNNNNIIIREMESWNKDKCRGWVGFSVKMAHRITAGCDMLLMPSRFEPCGLNQLYAMAYGTVPIVHHVGGLRDTVTQYNPYDNTGARWWSVYCRYAVMNPSRQALGGRSTLQLQTG